MSTLENKNKRVHILGICGTFMGGIAQIAKQAGYEVYGSDQNVYPPMSTQLEQAGIQLISGFENVDFSEQPDIVIVGNALSRGNPAVELMLSKGYMYTSGPEWLYKQVLKDQWVLAVSGTHGKTSTSSMLAWILEYAGFNPGFLIGGVPQNFGLSARLGMDGDEPSRFFVIEADEYDTAFFDKRSKFLHYHPKTLVINNLEFDHADIFDDLKAIQKQFHFQVRTVPPQGKVLSAANVEAIDEVLAMGCWSDNESLSTNATNTSAWSAEKSHESASSYTVLYKGKTVAEVSWDLIGDHNMQNGLSAIAAAHHVGILPEVAAQALAEYKTTKRRLELLDSVNDIHVYDDFAHHPTAIATTLAGIKAKIKTGRVIAVLEPRSNTMKMGVHNDTLIDSLNDADLSYLYIDDDLATQFQNVGGKNIQVYSDIENIVESIKDNAETNDHIIVMSNGGFQGIHQRIIQAL